MRRTIPIRTAAATAAVLPLLSACGGGGAASTQSHRPAAPHSRPTAVYRMALSGRAEPRNGAAQGRGFAIIAFHGASVVCWRFAHLHGFVAPTTAEIGAGHAHRAGAGVIRLGSGSRLHHQGCMPTAPAVSQRIMRDPSGFYVNVASQSDPAGAVRAQL